MNERIKELAEQANIYAFSTMGEYWIGPEEIKPGWVECRDQKFAELIVQECIDIVEDKVLASYNKEQHPNSYEAGHDCGMLYATGMIKEHFGVEE